MKPLVVIPARGGSKGIPEKNLKLLGGMPLIYWTVKQALTCFSSEDIVVSTDDQKIADYVMTLGVKVDVLRPKELATDTSPTIDTLLYEMSRRNANIKDKYDTCILLEPTSPLRKQDDILMALESFKERYDHYDSLCSYGKIRLENPVHVKRWNGSLMNPIIKAEKISRRQDSPQFYFPYGVIYISKLSMLKNKKKIYDKKSLPFFIEDWQCYEVDEPLDLVVAEALINKFLK